MEARLLNLPLPTSQQKQAAWRKVMSAYWDFMCMAAHEEEVKVELMHIRNRMHRRVLELKHANATDHINAIKRQLGNRFKMVARTNGRPASALPKQILRGLSLLRKETSESPQPPSEHPSQS